MSPRTKERPPFAQRLALIRKAKGLSQYDLAKATGISQRMIAHYETVIQNPNPDVLVRLAKALKVSADELVGLKPIKDKEPLIKNKRLLKKLQAFDSLLPEDQKAILKHIEALSGNNSAQR